MKESLLAWVFAGLVIWIILDPVRAGQTVRQFVGHATGEFVLR